MPEIALNMYYTMSVVVLVYLLGKYLTDKLSFLRKYCIPAPVVGGFIFALINTILTMSGVCTIVLDTTIQTLCMLLFFVNVGLGARWKILKVGGIQVVIMLAVICFLCFIQNAAGVALAQVFGIEPLLGICLGSIPMVGGNATAASFGPQLEGMGVANATVVASAAATYGLVAGCMIGGPIARRLITKHKLAEAHDQVQETGEEIKKVPNLHSDKVMPAVVIALILIGIGSILNWVIASCNIVMNVTVGVIITAAIFRNICDAKQIELPDGELESVANVGLHLFLCMAMMTLQLWKLVDLAVPMIITLLVQTLMMALFAYFVIFNVMKRDYEAAVMSSGVCGFGMGATPNAVANMEAVTRVYGPAPRAFLVVPIIGSMLADIVNSLILGGFMTYFG